MLWNRDLPQTKTWLLVAGTPCHISCTCGWACCIDCYLFFSLLRQEAEGVDGWT